MGEQSEQCNSGNLVFQHDFANPSRHKLRGGKTQTKSTSSDIIVITKISTRFPLFVVLAADPHFDVIQTAISFCNYSSCSYLTPRLVLHEASSISHERIARYQATLLGLFDIFLTNCSREMSKHINKSMRVLYVQHEFWKHVRWSYPLLLHNYDEDSDEKSSF